MSNPNPQSGFKTNPQNINKNGRPPKGYSITEWFKNMLNSNPDVRDAMGKSIIKKALEGDVSAQKMVWQYMDGLPKQTIEHGGELKLLPLIPVNEIRSNNSNDQDSELNQES